MCSFIHGDSKCDQVETTIVGIKHLKKKTANTTHSPPSMESGNVFYGMIINCLLLTGFTRLVFTLDANSCFFLGGRDCGALLELVVLKVPWENVVHKVHQVQRVEEEDLARW